MSEHFEQGFTSTSDTSNVTYIQYINPDNINVIIPNQGMFMKEEYLDEEHEDQIDYDDGEGRQVEVLESVVNIGKKIKPKVETTLTKELVQIKEGKQKGRKRLHPEQTRAIRKIKANTNQAYINTKGQEVKPKEFDETFECGCAKKCTQQISQKVRRQIFNMFWSIGTYEGRCAFLNSCVNEMPKKRQYTKTEKSRRNNTRRYFLKGMEVCKTAFTKTLKISNSRIDVSLHKMESENFNDERGKKRSGHGFPEEVKGEVIQHIKNNFSTDSSLRGLWNCFIATHPDQMVSESYYKRMFYENFNLRCKKVTHNKTQPNYQFTTAEYVQTDEDSSD